MDAGAEGGDDGQGSPKASKVPTQLKRLPKGNIQQVRDALAVLKENGLTDQVSVQDLLTVVTENLASSGSLSSTYMEMCEWARTRNMWAEAIGALEPNSNVQLAGQDDAAIAKALQELADEQTPATEATNADVADHEARTARLEKKKARHLETSTYRKSLAVAAEEGRLRRRFELDWEACFDKWWTAQVVGLYEIRRFRDDAFTPKSLGAGPGVLFAKLKGAAGFPKLKPKTSPPQPHNEDPEPKATGGSGKAFCTATLHVGSEGCGIGAALWRRLVAEHKISADGVSSNSSCIAKPHFDEAPNGRLVPRAVFLTDVPNSLSSAREVGHLPGSSLLSEEGVEVASPYETEFSGKAKLLFDAAKDRFRQQVERMDGLRSIVLTHSAMEVGGVAFTSAIVGSICSSYPKVVLQAVSVVAPCGESNDVLPILGSIRSHNLLMESTSYHIYVDNEALQRLCTSKIPCGLGLEDPTPENRYDLVAAMMSTWTSSARYGPCTPASDGNLRIDVAKVGTNLIPYPRINALVASYAPLLSADAGPHLDGERGIVWAGMQYGCLSSLKLEESKYMACAVACRGQVQKSALEAIKTLKTRREFRMVDWTPTGFFVGSHPDPAVPKDGECSCLLNSTAIGSLLGSWSEQAGSNHEEWNQTGAVSEDLENLAASKEDYEQVGMETVE